MNKVIGGLSVNTFGNKAGEPVIFLHGFPFDYSMWEKQIKALKNDYFCIAYDVRGLGKSFVGDGQYTMEMYVDDLFMIIEKMNLSKPVLCGLSMGGYISLRAVERDQEKFKGVILCDTRSEADTDEGKLKRANAIKQINAEGTDKFIENFVSGLFADTTKEENPSLYKNVLSRCKQSDPIGVKGALIAILSRTDTTQSLNKITIPTLLLAGAYDTLTPPVVMRSMTDKIRSADFASVPRAGHMAPIENPECVNDLIKAFLGRNV